jgi:hypothetical protein
MGVGRLGRRLVPASDQLRPIADALLQMALELQEDGGVLSGSRGPTALAHGTAGKALAGGAMKGPVMPFNPFSSGRPHRDLHDERYFGRGMAPTSRVTATPTTASTRRRLPDACPDGRLTRPPDASTGRGHDQSP